MTRRRKSQREQTETPGTGASGTEGKGESVAACVEPAVVTTQSSASVLDYGRTVPPSWAPLGKMRLLVQDSDSESSSNVGEETNTRRDGKPSLSTTAEEEAEFTRCILAELYFGGVQQVLKSQQYIGVTAKQGEIVDPDLGEIDAQVIVDSGGEISLQEILPGDALVVQTNCGSRIQTDTVIHGPSSIIVEVKASFPRPCVVRWSTKTECFIAFLERHPELQHFKKYVVVLFDGSRSPSAPHPQCSGQTQESRSTLRAKVKKFWESVLYCAVYTSRVELMHWPCEVLEKRLTKMGKLVDTTATEAEPERVEVLKKVPKRKKKGKNNPKGAHKSRNSRNTNKKCSC